MILFYKSLTSKNIPFYYDKYSKKVGLQVIDYLCNVKDKVLTVQTGIAFYVPENYNGIVTLKNQIKHITSLSKFNCTKLIDCSCLEMLDFYITLEDYDFTNYKFSENKEQLFLLKKRCFFDRIFRSKSNKLKTVKILKLPNLNDITVEICFNKTERFTFSDINNTEECKKEKKEYKLKVA